MEKIFCNCCGGSVREAPYKDQFAGAPLRACEACGHLQIQSAPSQQELNDYYASAYSQDRGQYVDENYAKIMVKRAEAQFQFIAEQLDLEAMKVCDYGAGYGYLVERFRHSSISCFGYESDARCISFAEERNVDMRPSPDSLNAGTLPGIDLLCMSHVLEHLPDPNSFLESLANVVPYVFIEVPMYSAALPSQFSDQEGHLNFYTEKSLCAFLSSKLSMSVLAVSRCGPSLTGYWGTSVASKFINRIHRRLSGDWFVNRYGANADGMWLRALVRTS